MQVLIHGERSATVTILWRETVHLALIGPWCVSSSRRESRVELKVFWSNTGYPQNPMIQWLIHMFVLE